MSEPVFMPRPIGFVRSTYSDTAQVPKGPGAKHEAVGTLEILPEFEAGLKDIEGFSHLFVIWVFHRCATGEVIPPPPYTATIRPVRPSARSRARAQPDPPSPAIESTVSAADNSSCRATEVAPQALSKCSNPPRR